MESTGSSSARSLPSTPRDGSTPRLEAIYLRRMLAWVPVALIAVIGVEVSSSNLIIGLILVAAAVIAGLVLRRRPQIRGVHTGHRTPGT